MLHKVKSLLGLDIQMRSKTKILVALLVVLIVFLLPLQGLIFWCDENSPLCGTNYEPLQLWRLWSWFLAIFVFLLIAHAAMKKVNPAYQDQNDNKLSEESMESKASMYENPRLTGLRDFVNDSARIYRTVFLVFVTFNFYFLAIVLSVDDVILFKDAALRTPILNIDIKASRFFIWGPVLILLIYLELLVQAHLLVKKIETYKCAAGITTKNAGEHAEALGAFLPIPLLQVVSGQHHGSTSSVILWFLIAVMLCILPIGTLAYIMYTFFPYQSVGISLWHKIAILIGLAMMLSLLWRLFLKETAPWIAWLIYALISGIIVALFMWPLLAHPVTWEDFRGENFETFPWKFLPWGEKKYKDMHALDVAKKRLYTEREHSPLDVCSEGDPTLGLDLSSSRSYIRANLSGAVLCHARLTGAKLQEANLEGAQLQRADLEDAQLQGAGLWRAQLQRADLEDAQLQGAVLWDAQLQGAFLGDAQLQGAVLGGAQLQGAVLVGAQLQGADLWRTQLQGAFLGDAQLQGAVLWDAQLQGAYLWGAQLQGVSSGPGNQYDSFEARIRGQQGKEPDFSTVVFAGGLSEEDMKNYSAGLKQAGWTEERIQELLRDHVEDTKSHNLPTDSGAVVAPSYNEKQAEQWIEEYKQALGIK